VESYGNNIPGHYIIAGGGTMRRREWDTTLYEIAEGQIGYFTAAQARSAGVHQVRLVQLQKAGDIERVSRGVYRLARYPISPLGQYMEATLWPQVRRPDVHAVVSHASALAFYGLSDVSPAKVHVTLPTDLRVRRTIPRHLVLHYADLRPEDIRHTEGVPVTTPERTIRDVHADNIGPALLRQAIEDGRRMGQLTYDEADGLERELLGTESSSGNRRLKRKPGAAP
jgi:predicted transcriptional regulator of viral defense system